jgi:hypothetical protein
MLSGVENVLADSATKAERDFSHKTVQGKKLGCGVEIAKRSELQHSLLSETMGC